MLRIEPDRSRYSSGLQALKRWCMVKKALPLRRLRGGMIFLNKIDYKEEMMMMSDVLLESLENGVLTLTMNRPERLNALTPDLTLKLLNAVSQAAENPQVKVLVLTGAGRGFCAGGDVGDMAEGTDFPDRSYEDNVRRLRRAMEASRLLHDMPKPTISMVRGPMAGAGMSLALACDLCIASDTTTVTTAFGKVGLSGDFGGTYYLTQRVGSAKAKELYFTSPRLKAQEAHSLGLFTRLVPDAELESEAMTLAHALAAGPTVTLGYIKKNINFAEHGTLAEAMDAEAMHHMRCAMTDDHHEAAAAFVEKRAPVFKGK